MTQKPDEDEAFTLHEDENHEALEKAIEERRDQEMARDFEDLQYILE